MPSVPDRSAEPPFVVTLDVGTSSVRALLFDRQARNVQGMEARCSYTPTLTPDGGAELEAERLLAFSVGSLRDLLEHAGTFKEKIAGVAVCTFWHSLLGVDPEGVAFTPVYTWADTRSDSEAREMKARLDERAFHSRTGARFHPLYLPAKLLWLSRRLPESRRRVARWMSFGEFLLLKLFGKTSATVSMASGTGLLNVHSCAYDEEILRFLEIRPEQLSPIVDLSPPFAGYGPSGMAAELPDVPWFPPVGDGACSSLGSGCTTRDRIAVMVGTSGAMRAAWAANDVSIPWGLWCYRADRRRFVMGGALSEGGNLVDWVRQTVRVGDLEEVDRELAAMEPDAHGLTFLPFLAGERSPGWAAHARGAISGLRLATRPVEILRAAMEAVALRFALIYRLLSEEVPQAREVVGTGGALLRSPAWVQMLADALGKPIMTSAEPEASSRGAALLALEALGAVRSVEEVPAAFGPTVEPDSARHQKYLRALERQQNHYELLVKP